jgi:hypothetical protein
MQAIDAARPDLASLAVELRLEREVIVPLSSDRDSVDSYSLRGLVVGPAPDAFGITKKDAALLARIVRLR